MEKQTKRKSVDIDLCEYKPYNYFTPQIVIELMSDTDGVEEKFLQSKGLDKSCVIERYVDISVASDKSDNYVGSKFILTLTYSEPETDKEFENRIAQEKANAESRKKAAEAAEKQERELYEELKKKFG